MKLGWLGGLLSGTWRPYVQSQRQKLGLEEVRGGHGGTSVERNSALPTLFTEETGIF